jgi:hypothetical protein
VCGVWRAGVAAAGIAVAAVGAHAQQAVPTRPRPLVRVDAIAARTTALQAGVGAGVPAGTYLRVEGVIAAGVGRRRRAGRTPAAA